MQNDLVANLAAVRKRIENAALRAGRDAEDVKLVAVSKTHPADMIEQVIAAGATTFGENKVQEAEWKIPDVGRLKAEWHLIGHLQSNKARKAVQLFDVIHSLDSVDLAARLERICLEENRPALPVFVQVDLAREETKSGVTTDELPALTDYLRSCTRVIFDGLMLLPPFSDNAEDARPFFRELKGLRDELASDGAFPPGRRGELSMGMSHDFEIAIEEGATVIRVGTAIFGERG
ncbi:MAG TPA: YggS family pyridoxal phosphate-dependent enzyme [Pyrinomonadaceae bacterium]|nr:YggS family pyridoxal phosphate-dependent enzyme [Pyrinomonadaceae bacterium]